MVKIRETPIKMDDLGGKPHIFGLTPISLFMKAIHCFEILESRGSLLDLPVGNQTLHGNDTIHHASI